MKSNGGIHMTLVVKVSKLCNLRCTYCYETPELANRARMSVEDISQMFRNLRDFFKSEGYEYKQCRVQFVWHGGEPFAQPISYWEEIIAAQKKIFGVRFQKKAVLNTVQTNLTLLGDRHLPLLRENFDVGFSYDVGNHLRVNMAGKPTDETVRRKAEWAQAEGLNLGGIAVISNANADRPEAVADYFLSRGMGFRALNIYEHLDALEQIRNAAIPFQDYIEFCRKLYAMPAVKQTLEEGRLSVDPLTTARELLRLTRRMKKKVSISENDCVSREWALGINTNGDTYGIGDLYFPEYRYGNIFTHSIPELLASEGRARRMARSRERMKAVCSSCFMYRKGCAGTYVSHASPESYRDYVKAGGCEMKLLADEMRGNSSKRNDASVARELVSNVASNVIVASDSDAKKEKRKPDCTSELEFTV